MEYFSQKKKADKSMEIICSSFPLLKKIHLMKFQVKKIHERELDYCFSNQLH